MCLESGKLRKLLSQPFMIRSGRSWAQTDRFVVIFGKKCHNMTFLVLLHAKNAKNVITLSFLVRFWWFKVHYTQHNVGKKRGACKIRHHYHITTLNTQSVEEWPLHHLDSELFFYATEALRHRKLHLPFRFRPTWDVDNPKPTPQRYVTMRDLQETKKKFENFSLGGDSQAKNRQIFDSPYLRDPWSYSTHILRKPGSHS